MAVARKLKLELRSGASDQVSDRLSDSATRPIVVVDRHVLFSGALHPYYPIRSTIVCEVPPSMPPHPNLLPLLSIAYVIVGRRAPRSSRLDSYARSERGTYCAAVRSVRAPQIHVLGREGFSAEVLPSVCEHIIISFLPFLASSWKLRASMTEVLAIRATGTLGVFNLSPGLGVRGH